MGYNLKDNNNTKEEKCQQKLKDSLNKESQKLKNFEIFESNNDDIEPGLFKLYEKEKIKNSSSYSFLISKKTFLLFLLMIQFKYSRRW